MIEKDDFKSLGENENQFKHTRIRQKTGVIKSSRNNLSGTLHLNHQDEAQEAGVEFFQPIMEGDMVVGVIHKCSCGKTSELKFQYSDT